MVLRHLPFLFLSMFSFFLVYFRLLTCSFEPNLHWTVNLAVHDIQKKKTKCQKLKRKR